LKAAQDQTSARYKPILQAAQTKYFAGCAAAKQALMETLDADHTYAQKLAYETIIQGLKDTRNATIRAAEAEYNTAMTSALAIYIETAAKITTGDLS
jgi:hypothetical protein